MLYIAWIILVAFLISFGVWNVLRGEEHDDNPANNETAE